MHSFSSTPHSLKFKIDIKERRRQLTSLLSKSISESEIAKQLGVDQSTISRDIKVLKSESQQFVYDLAKSDLKSAVLMHLSLALVTMKTDEIIRDQLEPID